MRGCPRRCAVGRGIAISQWTPFSSGHIQRSDRMKKRRIGSPVVPEPPPQTWSNALVVGNQVFVAGMTARSGSEVVGGDSMYGQSRAIFEKIRHLMEAAGGKMDDIVKVVIF